ncbi:MAG: hypothetical protein ACM3PY_07260, partial [Omnitrophica WOR_2 bacterium]
MVKELRVVIIEDDPYARDMMSMLLTRDWRTRVVAEYGSNAEAELKQLFAKPANPVDVILIDTEVPADPRWVSRASQIALSQSHPPVIIYTCTKPDAGQLEHLQTQQLGGYLVKGEILYALVTAISEAVKGHTVITPGVQQLGTHFNFSKPVVVLDGRVPVTHFTRRENDLVRLGILFNLAQRDIADELVVSTDFISEVMGQVYEKLGLHDILSGECLLETYFEDETVLSRCRAVLTRASSVSGEKGIRKAPWMSTIAFHLL